MNYCHSPLPRGNFIRILHVNIDPSTEQPVCNFETIQIHHDEELLKAMGTARRRIKASKEEIESKKTLTDDDETILGCYAILIVALKDLCVSRKAYNDLYNDPMAVGLGSGYIVPPDDATEESIQEFSETLQKTTNTIMERLTDEYEVHNSESDPKTPNYTAISYAWSDTTPVRRIACTDGRYISLSITLSDLLNSLQQQSQSFTLWIDALCIDQENLEERAHQVDIMGKVYAAADEVLVWLGKANDSSRIIHEYSKFLSTFQLCPDRKATDWNEWNNRDLYFRDVLIAYYDFVQRPWFSRIWVIQEAAMGKTCIFLCGTDRTPVETITTIQEDYIHLPGCKEKYGSYDLSDVRAGFRAGVILATRHSYRWNGFVEYSSLFSMLRHFQATDSRDIIFAIRSLTDRPDLFPATDYTRPVEDIFVDLSAKVFCEGNSLQLLGIAGVGPHFMAFETLGLCELLKRTKLPSWVFDLRLPIEVFLASHVLEDRERENWDAARFRGIDIRLPAPQNLVRNELQLKGFRFETVCRTGPRVPKGFSAAGIRDTLREIVRFASTSGIGVDVVSRCLVADQLGDLDNRAVVAHFEEFLEESPLIASDRPLSSVYYELLQEEKFSGSRIFISNGGHLGYTWPMVTEGDDIWLIPGCPVPLIIRPEEPKEEDGLDVFRGELVGRSYIQGIMHGEGIKEDMELMTLVLT